MDKKVDVTNKYNHEILDVKNKLRQPMSISCRIRNVYCIIKMDKVAKGIPHFCNYEFPNIAKAIAGTH